MLLLMTNINVLLCIRFFVWFQSQRLWMTLNGYYAVCFKMHASVGAHHENLIYYSTRGLLSTARLSCL